MTEMIQLETHPSVILKVRADVTHQYRVCLDCRGTGQYWVRARLPSFNIAEALLCPSCGGCGHFRSHSAPISEE